MCYFSVKATLFGGRRDFQVTSNKIYSQKISFTCRRSVGSEAMKELLAYIDDGKYFEFSEADVHVAAMILKKFLGDLPKPLLTFDMFNSILHFPGITFSL